MGYGLGWALSKKPFTTPEMFRDCKGIGLGFGLHKTTFGKSSHIGKVYFEGKEWRNGHGNKSYYHVGLKLN